MTNKLAKNKINHVSLVLDASGSMGHLRSSLIKVVDGLIADLARESKQLNQETRVTVYSFDHVVTCLVWDMDVLRLPSIRELYEIGGATALLEAVLKSIDDMAHTWEEYGEHSFLQITITDGEENASGGRFHHNDPRVLGALVKKVSSRITGLPDHWTSAILVPDVLAKRKALTYGFPAGNVAVWNADSAKGAEEVIAVVGAATKTFMQDRTRGVRGTKNLFAVGQDISVDEVKATLTPLDARKYKLLTVRKETEIRPFVQGHDLSYTTGCAYYQLGSRVTVQASKEVAVLEKSTDRVFSGPAARDLLFGGTGQGSISVKAGHNPDLEVYVQSRSVNRKLKPNTRLLVML